MVAKWATIIFFLALGISFFAPFTYSDLIVAVSAIVAGVAMIVGK